MIYAARALDDIERLADFLLDSDPASARSTGALIVEAISLLERHPLVGRAVDPFLRELVISRGPTGYVALYRFEPQLDVVLVLALRHQREAGYSRPG